MRKITRPSHRSNRHVESLNEKVDKPRANCFAAVCSQYQNIMYDYSHNRKATQASIRIQCAWRCYLARRRAQDCYRGRYRKIYDHNQRCYVYQNKVTKDMQDDLPDFFGNQEIPNPPERYGAPFDYNPGNEPNGDGFALIISNSQFPLGQWVPSHPELDDDHDKLRYVLTHEFMGRVRPEHCFSLKNATTLEVKEALKRLHRVIRRDAFLFVYIATHVLNIRGGGDPENEGETTYFAFRNSIWGKTKEITESTIGITELTNLLNKIKCRYKTIALNYAHAPPPRQAFFSSSKQVYPVPNLLRQLSELCHCPVIAACAIGFKMKDYMKGYPAINWQDPHTPILPSGGVMMKDKVKSGTKTKSMMSTQTMVDKLIHPSGSNLTEDPSEDSDDIVINDPEKGLYGTFYSKTWENLMKDLALKIKPPISKTSRPAAPHPVWTQNEQTGFAIKVDLPDAHMQNSYWRQLLYWRLLRTGAKPVNVCKRIIRHQERVNMTAPRQASLTYQGNSLFGAAMIAAFRGGASRSNQSYVTLFDVFVFIYKHMNQVLDEVNIARKNAEEEAARLAEEAAKKDDKTNTYKRTKKDKDSKKDNKKDEKKGKGKEKGKSVGNDKKTTDQPKSETKSNIGSSSIESTTMIDLRVINQTPCIYIPNGELSFLWNPICYRCGPPTAPERPYVLQTYPTSVLLEWFNPPFDGVPPVKYKIHMQNVTRNFHHWEEVYYAGEITKTKFLVRNLPIGVSCQFKVSAYNNGGWSAHSDPTSFVTPGEEQGEITRDLRWHRVRQGGVLSILDQMTKYRINRDEQLIGLRILHGIGCCNSGYKSTAFALEIAQKCFEVAQSFPSDADIMTLVFNTLTWCLHGKSERKVRQYCNTNHLDELVARQADKFRHHTGLINSIQGLRSGNMHKYLPEIPEFKYKVLFPAEEKKVEESDDDDENEGEDDGSEISLENGSIKSMGLASVSIG